MVDLKVSSGLCRPHVCSGAFLVVAGLLCKCVSSVEYRHQWAVVEAVLMWVD